MCMKPVELTETQVADLTCAADAGEPAVALLFDRAHASSIEGVLVSIDAARGFDRSVLLALVRQALAQHRPGCEACARRQTKR